MSVWNKDKTERVIRLQHLLESGFNVIEEFDNVFVFNKETNYKVVNKDYKLLWEYQKRYEPLHNR